jgi:hypothetical protein
VNHKRERAASAVYGKLNFRYNVNRNVNPAVIVSLRMGGKKNTGKGQKKKRKNEFQFCISCFLGQAKPARKELRLITHSFMEEKWRPGAQHGRPQHTPASPGLSVT